MVLPNILNSNSILSPATAVIDLALKEVLVFFPLKANILSFIIPLIGNR